jgi:NitT/TauT family transport system permease protein
MSAGWAVRWLPPVGSLVVLTGLAEVAIRVGRVSPLLLPPPSAVLAVAVSESPALLSASSDTATAVLVGLGLSAVVGVTIAVGLSTSRFIERAFYPYAIFFQVVPIVAIAPLLVIWFGYGIRAVIASAFIVSIFPVIANTLAGLLSVDPALRDLFRIYRAGPVDTLFRLRLPAALPDVLTGLRVASGLAVIGAIVGEFVGGGGLGVVILGAMREQRTDLVFAAVGYASLLGLVLFGLASLASHLSLRRWHASEKELG